MNYSSNIEFRLIKPIIEEVYTIGEDRILNHIEYQESYDFDKYITEKVNRIITQYKKDHSIWARMLKYIKKIYSSTTYYKQKQIRKQRKEEEKKKNYLWFFYYFHNYVSKYKV